MKSSAVLIEKETQQSANVMRWALGSILVAALVLAQSMMALAKGAPESFADLAESISPSVVNITTSTTVSRPAQPGPVVPEGSPFEDFFQDFLDRREGQGNRQQRSQALGSGFVISEDGFIVTNNHVIDGADEIMIEFFSGEELPAKLIGRDPNTDIALLKVESDEPLKFVGFGDSDVARVGDWVMAMGNPLGQGFSVSVGIISARNRALAGSYDDYIQTDAAINRGNSGGPLFNMDGEVVGVNTAILSPNGGSIGIGFSMSSAVVSKVVAQLQEFGETRRGWLGVRIQDVDADVADALGLETAAGALVTDVPEGPSMEAGVKAGDVITSFDGVEVEDTRALVRQVGETEVGKAVTMVVFREGKVETLAITLGRRETAEGTGDAPASTPEKDKDPVEKEILGVTLMELTDKIRDDLEMPKSAGGLLVKDISETSEAFEKGLRAGDVISEAGQQAVNSLSDLEDRIEDAKDAGRKSLLLLVRRAGEPRYMAVNLS